MKMKELSLKFYSNDPEIGEVKDIEQADFAVSRTLLTLEEVYEKYSHLKPIKPSF
jgi:hypothetical protein